LATSDNWQQEATTRSAAGGATTAARSETSEISSGYRREVMAIANQFSAVIQSNNI